MDFGMDIAALSVGMAEARTQQQLGISILKEAMEASRENVMELMEEISASLDPALGATVDIMA